MATGINLVTTISKEGIKFNSHSSKSRTDENESSMSPEWCINWSFYFRDHLKEQEDNTEKLNKDIDHSDLVITMDGTTLDVAFLYSGASIASRLYYYYYPTSEEKSINASDIYSKFCNDKFLMFKNCGREHNGAINQTDADTEGDVGTTQRLYFYGNDMNSEPTDKFPKGYSVGFFILSSWDDTLPPFFTNKYLNSFSSQASIDKKYRPFDSYADNTSENYTNDLYQQRQVARFKTDRERTVIFGWEDLPAKKDIEKAAGLPAPDVDFNDFIFAVSYSPDGGVKTDGDKEIDRGTEGTPLEGTLLYEDLYPDQGDYDMNDLVIRYKYVPILSSSQDGVPTNIIAVRCEFEPYHDGAQFTHDFHLAFYRDINSMDKNTSVFKNHKVAVANKEKYTIALDFTGNPLDEILINQFAPYVYVHETGYQVHLSGYTIINGKTDGLSPAELNYWSTEDNTYPYAMCIPTTDFKPVTEGKRIETDYPLYIQWADSRGEEAKDWYLSKNRSVN